MEPLTALALRQNAEISPGSVYKPENIPSTEFAQDVFEYALPSPPPGYYGPRNPNQNDQRMPKPAWDRAGQTKPHIAGRRWGDGHENKWTCETRGRRPIWDLSGNSSYDTVPLHERKGNPLDDPTKWTQPILHPIDNTTVTNQSNAAAIPSYADDAIYERIQAKYLDKPEVREIHDKYIGANTRKTMTQADIFAENFLRSGFNVEIERIKKVILEAEGLEYYPDGVRYPIQEARPTQGATTRAIGAEVKALAHSRAQGHTPADFAQEQQKTHQMSSKEMDKRLAIDIWAPVLANLHATAVEAARGNDGGLVKYGRPPPWAIDHSPQGNKSFFDPSWATAPQRVGRDARYQDQGVMHEGNYTYFQPTTGLSGGPTSTHGSIFGGGNSFAGSSGGRSPAGGHGPRDTAGNRSVFGARSGPNSRASSGQWGHK